MRFVPFSPTARGRGTRKTTNSMVSIRLLRTSGVSGGRWCGITRLTGHFIGTAFAGPFRLDGGLAQKGQHRIRRKCNGGRVSHFIGLKRDENDYDAYETSDLFWERNEAIDSADYGI